MRYIGVDSIDTACQKLEEAGGTIACPRDRARSTEGNILYLHEGPKKGVADSPRGQGGGPFEQDGSLNCSIGQRTSILNPTLVADGVKPSGALGGPLDIFEL
jgi:hypothetical protein